MQDSFNMNSGRAWKGTKGARSNAPITVEKEWIGKPRMNDTQRGIISAKHTTATTTTRQKLTNFGRNADIMLTTPGYSCSSSFILCMQNFYHEWQSRPLEQHHIIGLSKILSSFVCSYGILSPKCLLHFYDKHCACKSQDNIN